MDDVKACRKCGTVYPATTEHFGERKRYKDGLFSWCRGCEREYKREYLSRPGVRERMNANARARGPRPAEQTRRHQLWTFYRLTPEDWSAMLEGQGARCANPGCRTDEPGKRGWIVDHDHGCCDSHRSCGKCVRGLLCNRCNVMLGMARDNAAALLGGASYLLGYNNSLMSALGPIGG